MDARPSFDVRKRVHPLRLAVSAAGLAVFNLFMLVPALVYAALLCAVYAASLVFYLTGIATTASGLAGANELVLDWPGQPRHGAPHRLFVRIGDHGIDVTTDEGAADGKIRITTDMDADSRTTQTLAGAGLVLGGILLFLLSLVVTRYSWRGLKRYAQFNRALLTG